MCSLYDNRERDYLISLIVGSDILKSKKIKTHFKTKTEIEDDCLLWAREIEKEFKPELIIFIAKSGFLFARPLAKYFNCEIVDVVAIRSDNGTKDIVKKLIPRMPKSLLAFLLEKRVSDPNYYKYSDRTVSGTSRFHAIDMNSYRRILLVDDSVDTGWSLIKVKEYLENNGAAGKYKIASYCVLSESNKRVSVDFARYTDSIVLTATSRYSKEYDSFIQDYEEWKHDLDQVN